MPETKPTIKELLERITPGKWRSEKIIMSKYGVDAYFEVKNGPEDESVGIFSRDVCQTIMREIATESELLTQDEANVELISRAPALARSHEAARKIGQKLYDICAYLPYQGEEAADALQKLADWLAEAEKVSQ